AGPVSINAQTQADLQRAHAQTIEHISRNVASLTVQNLGPGQSQVSVRGVSAGQIVRDQPGVKEQVGVYLDESVVSLSLFTPDFDLFDLNRVETLRGPQGTLFGSGSVGGTIRYITNQARTDRIEGTVEGGVNVVEGGDIGYDVKGAVNVPMSDKAALRIVGYHTHFGGFVDAVGPAHGKNVNDGSRTGTRISLLWQPAPQVKVTPRFVTDSPSAGLPPSIAPAADLPSNLRDTTNLNQFTQELRFSSTGGGPFQWVFGGFYSNAHRTYHQRLPTPGYDAQAGDPFLVAL